MHHLAVGRAVDFVGRDLHEGLRRCQPGVLQHVEHQGHVVLHERHRVFNRGEHIRERRAVDDDIHGADIAGQLPGYRRYKIVRENCTALGPLWVLATDLYHPVCHALMPETVDTRHLPVGVVHDMRVHMAAD